VSGPVFMFCAPRLIFGGTEGIGSCFHVLPSQARFRRYRWCRVSVSCFALPVSFSAVQRASVLGLMICEPIFVFGGTEGVRPRFHVLRSRTRFRQYRVHRVPFSCFALPDSFSVAPRASGRAFMFPPPELILGGTEGVGSHFRVLCSRTRFRQYRGRRVLC
jgi:hypothetical protein